MSKPTGKISKELALEIAAIAGDAGARAAVEAYKKESERSARERADRRLHNTELLLKNYRMFKAHAENAVYSAQDIDEDAYDIIDLMSDRGNDSEMVVESIKQSVARTVTIVSHIDTMLKLYHTYCVTAGTPEEMRRWDVVSGLYIEDPPKTIRQLANDHICTDRTIYRDIDDAYGKIAALIFGIDGIRKA